VVIFFFFTTYQKAKEKEEQQLVNKQVNKFNNIDGKDGNGNVICFHYGSWKTGIDNSSSLIAKSYSYSLGERFDNEKKNNIWRSA